MSEYTCRKIMDSSQVIQLFGFWGFHFSKLLNFNYMRLNIFLCDYHIYFYCIFGGAQQDIGFIPNDTDCFGRLLPSDPIIGLKLLRPKYKTIIWNIPGGWKERLNTLFFEDIRLFMTHPVIDSSTVQCIVVSNLKVSFDWHFLMFAQIRKPYLLDRLPSFVPFEIPSL